MNPGINPGLRHPDANPIWLAYYDNVLYDVVMAVRGCREWGPKYTKICDMVNYPTDTVVNFLRHAETLRYIAGKFGYYNKNGGGAKCWFMADPADYVDKPDLYGVLNAGKVPPYPYDWLTLYSDHKGTLDAWLKENAHVIIRRDDGHVIFIGQNRAELKKEYRRLYADKYAYHTNYEKKILLHKNTPSPYIMSDYGKEDSPRPIRYDYGRWRWVWGD